VPDTWYDLATSARRAAYQLASERHRSCLNRAYYAAFSKVNHALVGTPGVFIRLGREGVNHAGESGTGGIRRWIQSHMPGMDQPKREKLSELIGRLYTLRIAADYQPSVTVDAREAISIGCHRPPAGGFRDEELNREDAKARRQDEGNPNHAFPSVSNLAERPEKTNWPQMHTDETWRIDGRF
jgi:hypothetical protein